MSQVKERRYKTFMVREQDLINVLVSYTFSKKAVRLVIDDLPNDFEIIAIHYSFNFNCFDVVVYSSEFPIVPDYNKLPELSTSTHVINLQSDYDKKLLEQKYFSPTIEEKQIVSKETIFEEDFWEQEGKRIIKEQRSLGNNPFDKD